jgi:iron(II)-dependent oxidoreductase
MVDFSNLQNFSKAAEVILCPPFEWCWIKGGTVNLEDATSYEGAPGGTFQVADFAIAMYPTTNAQYEKFLQNPSGFANPQWWHYSPAASQWRKDHPRAKPTAFQGNDLPRTRVSWFDSVAFCQWLSAELEGMASETDKKTIYPASPPNWMVRLPTEQEWQRAALGDTGWRYPWGDELNETRANYGGKVGQPASVQKYPAGQSPFEVMDMIGNVWEWCLTGWGKEDVDVSGYTYRIIRGGAWNISNPDYLRANDRGCHPPRGRLNDAGFRCGYFQVELR